MSHPRALRLRCRRGMLELDYLLSGFLEKAWPALKEEHRQAFETLLGYPDERLWAYLSGLDSPPEGTIAHVVERIRKASP